MYNKIFKKFIVQCNFSEGDDYGSSFDSPYNNSPYNDNELLNKFEKEFYQIIKNKIKLFNNNVKLNLLKIKYYKEEIKIEEFINNFCFDKKNNKEIIFEKIKKINIYNPNINKITKIPEYIKEFPNLKTLIINNNNLENIDNISYCKNLEEIDFLNNKINDITSLKDLKNIKKLILSKNNLKDITPLKSKDKLKIFSADNNYIKNIPKNSWNYLEKLDLSNNDIKTLENINYSISIQEINLSNNSIDTIDLNTIFLHNLDIPLILNLNNNNIGNALSKFSIFAKEEFFKRLIRCKDLRLSNNNLKNKDFYNDKTNLLQHLENLKYLELNNNKINNLITFILNYDLRDLQLDNNKIKSLLYLNYFDNKHHKNLINISLKNNQIRILNYIEENNNIEAIHLQDNPLKYNYCKELPYDELNSILKYNKNNIIKELITYEDRKVKIDKLFKIRKNKFLKNERKRFKEVKLKLRKEKKLNMNDNKNLEEEMNIREDINFGF